MKTTWPLAAAMALALAAPAFAAPDPIGYTASDGVNAVAVTAASPLPVTGPTGASAMQVQGTAASGVAAAGNPVLGAGTNGAGAVQILPVNVEGSTISGRGLSVSLLSSGNNTILLRDVTGASAAGSGVGAIGLIPNSAPTGANSPAANTTSGSNLVVKAAAGNLYGWRVTAAASAGYVLIFDATSAPADGVVSPKDCVAVAANATVGSGPLDIPERYTTGITIVFSTTGCFLKTASATAFIRATYQ